MHVEDHCRGILQALQKGKSGEAYNISTPTYLTNIDLTRRILKILGKPLALIKKVQDRVGHDRRYAIEPAKLKKIGWKPRLPFDDSLRETVLWYKENKAWWQKIKEKQEEFKAYYAKAYQDKG
jgi:dTDP-glucose 4,6-dehydratase